MHSQRQLSRRSLLSLAAPLATAAFSQSRQQVITAGAIIDRIKANVGVSWRQETVDKIVFGSPEMAVKGIATTMMATLEVIERAAKAGCNLIITHEPTFYSHQDTNDTLKNDPIYLHKSSWMTKNNIVVFRFHDHWHARRPDGVATGMAKELDWEKFYAAPDNPRQFRFPAPVPLATLVKELETKLKAGAVRVVGDPALAVRTAAANWGYASQNATSILARPDIDVLICGETREWEVVEYAQDMVSAGMKKALIVIGHVQSEQAGMKHCAEWLSGLVTEVPVRFIASAEPFWPKNR